MQYDHGAIEERWQRRWARDRYAVWAASDRLAQPKRYVLDMFPYPSGDGLHVGHVEGYTASDILSRFFRMRGANVLHPIGWDAFGLPAENYALKVGKNPMVFVPTNIDHFRRQLQRLGFSYDWQREFSTTDPDYYRWTQWLFLLLYRRGLVYEAEAPINFCPSCKTGLAREEAAGGRCDRCGSATEVRSLTQWHLAITRYADRLLDDLTELDWPESTKELQRHWIGKSIGYEVLFTTEDRAAQLPIFTTRLDTIYGVTFLVLAPEHPLADRISKGDYASIVERYLERLQVKSERERLEEHEISGVFTGSYATHPLTGRRLPIWVSEYVLAGYGTGAIMAVPAHDQRDQAFAKKFSLPIEPVIAAATNANGARTETYDGLGTLIHSDEHTGLSSTEAIETIGQLLIERKLAEQKTHYKLRDWVFSRQRYWGEPIPLIRCERCGVVPVPERDLPVVLPKVQRYQPTGTGESPLAAIERWVKVRCPNCRGDARRETQTMPQWAGSCWYYLRFIDPQNNRLFANPRKLKQWLPVDVYVGGAEHAVLHLLYARFWHKVLFDAGLVPTLEPFQRLVNQGLILGPDHEKMSKSRGNVVSPDAVIREHGADALRLYEMFMGPLADTKPWSTDGIRGLSRFLRSVWLLGTTASSERGRAVNLELTLEQALHRTIVRVTHDLEQLKFNTAISALMELQDKLRRAQADGRRVKSALLIFVRLLFPLAPHLSQELWAKFGKRTLLDHEPWPEANPKFLATTEQTIVVQIDGRKRLDLTVPTDTPYEEIERTVRANPRIQMLLKDKKIAKTIFAGGKLINFVTK